MKATPRKRGKVEAGGGKRWGDGRVAVLGHLDRLRQWVSEGRSRRAYYDDHATELGISYAQFARHARAHVEPLSPSSKSTKHVNPAPPPPEVVSVNASRNWLWVTLSDQLPHHEVNPIGCPPEGRSYAFTRDQAKQLLTKLQAALQDSEVDQPPAGQAGAGS
jgi:hypothetical protein